VGNFISITDGTVVGAELGLKVRPISRAQDPPVDAVNMFVGEVMTFPNQ
jgi:hypothetical protein